MIATAWPMSMGARLATATIVQPTGGGGTTLNVRASGAIHKAAASSAQQIANAAQT